MTNDSIFQFLRSCVLQVLAKANEFKIYENGSVSVSLIQFFLSLSILGIVLHALLNFVRSSSLDIVNNSNRERLHRRRVAEAEARRRSR